MLRNLPFLLVILCLLVCAAGCGALRSAVADPGQLPDYPRVASTMTPGQTVSYKDISLTLGDIVREDSDPVVMFTLTRGRETSNYSAAFNEYLVSGDLLVQFQSRSNAEAADDLAVATLYWLPELMRPGTPRAARDLSESRPGEIAFFQDGFVAIVSIHENDYVATDDDSVILTFWTPADAMEDISLREFSSMAIGESLLKVGNVYGGDQPGQGRVELSIVPKANAWEGANDREEVMIPYRGTVEWRGHDLRAESIPGGWRSRILLSVTRGEDTHDVVMTEGQAWRHGNVAWRFDGVSGSAARLTAYEFDQSIFPDDVRDGTAPPEQRAQNPRAPTTIERELVTNQSVEFWGARIRLARVLEMDPTNLFDDVAEFVFDTDGRLQSVLVREGERASVRGDNRWYIVEVKSATPSAQGRSGNAEVILSTGTFYNP